MKASRLKVEDSDLDIVLDTILKQIEVEVVEESLNVNSSAIKSTKDKAEAKEVSQAVMKTFAESSKPKSSNGVE